MLTHITCECGNEVPVFGEHTDMELRCSRCGRRVSADGSSLDCSLDEDLQSVSMGGGSHALSHVRSATYAPKGRNSDDPEATVAHMTLASPKPSGKPLSGPEADTLPSDDFEINPQHPVVDSETTPRGGSGNGSSQGTKYDLSQRVMRPIAKLVPPIVPYTGTGEYGIHRILRIHQRGGMGRILVAYDQYLKREVAIKELHSDVAEDESIVRRFIGEAEITAQLEHPGVVPIHRIGQGTDGLPYYTMKLIKGDTLQDAIKAYHRKPSRAELLNLIRRLISVSKTIAFAHSKGVIHRDLKPANVMLGEHGETLVMDWGLAKPFNQGIEESYISFIHQTRQPRPELTMVGAIVGTPAFMSPEQAMAEDNVVGPLSDVFSLGTVLYYLLAGQTAFSGRSTQEVLNKVRACTPPPPSRIKSNVPSGLEAICLKAMEKLPENRYQGASEFADDLCRWLDDEPIVAAKPTVWTKLRWWIMRHRTLAMGLPSVLILSAILSCLGVWLIARNTHNAVEPVNHSQGEATEFITQIQVLGSPCVDIWTIHQHTGDLLLTCHVKPTDSETHHTVSVYAPEGAPWDLSDRHFLTFSLLEFQTADNVLIRNLRVRLGQQKESYYEYKPSKKLWDNRNRASWVPFTVPLSGNRDEWNREIVGMPTIKKVEWIEIHFDADAETILNFGNFKFQK